MIQDKRLSVEDCYKYYKEYGTPDRVIGHCKAVSDVAVELGRNLNRIGYNFDLNLLRTAGLIHDVARTRENHAKVAADMLEKEGFHREAEIVGVHMRYEFKDMDDITETDIVCLSDRLVREDKYVGMNKRFEYLMHKRKLTPGKIEHLLELKTEIKAYIGKIEAKLGRSLDSLFFNLPEEFLKQVEKPARYTGNEINCIVKDSKEVELRFAFAFPDLYEIGMSYMGLQIIYNIMNNIEGVACERVFAPATDMEKIMRDADFPLFTLETKTPIENTDILGFTLQYEMSFTNILNMLELSHVPVLAKERDEYHPLVIGGGPCAFNPEPLADFFDLFLIGDGEESLPELIETVRRAKRRALSKQELLKECVKLDGVYVPAFYEPVYDRTGKLVEYKKLYNDAPDKVGKALIHDLEKAEFPTKSIVPLIETVHDRAVVETFRGCTRGCRFCQAGMIYRPVRERSKDKIMALASEQLKNTGHDELSILSLSTSDYSAFKDLAIELTGHCKEKNVSLSLPSLRLDNFSFEVLNEIQRYKKSGLTFAPEAGTQRLRDVINKGITEEDIYSAVEQAVSMGWRHVKLYFMIGLPTETNEDLDGIVEIAGNIVAIHRKSGKGGRFNVTVSISNFVPKAHTPFQWFPQNSTDELRKKHNYLVERLKIKGVTFNYHDDAVSTCEAIFARGDRRTSQILISAHKAGCKFDGWSEHFDRRRWDEVLNGLPYDYKFYTERARGYDEFLPWDIIDSGVSKQYLMAENERAMNGDITQDCRYGCTSCGVNRRTVCRQGGIYV